MSAMATKRADELVPGDVFETNAGTYEVETTYQSRSGDLQYIIVHTDADGGLGIFLDEPSTHFEIVEP